MQYVTEQLAVNVNIVLIIPMIRPVDNVYIKINGQYLHQFQNISNTANYVIKIIETNQITMVINYV